MRSLKLSMGMSNDYEISKKYGSNLIKVANFSWKILLFSLFYFNSLFAVELKCNFEKFIKMASTRRLNDD